MNVRINVYFSAWTKQIALGECVLKDDVTMPKATMSNFECHRETSISATKFFR